MNPSIESASLESAPTTAELLVLGIGDAGCAVLERLQASGAESMRLVALNTDTVALKRCSIPDKHLIGKALTRGLGCGGDSSQGSAAAECDLEVIRTLVTDAKMVCILAGLAGGTGGGASPVAARLARQAGALVLAFAVLPFDFEGFRRRSQADEALQSLRREADAVVCIPNQGIAGLFAEKPLFTEVYATANSLFADGVSGIWKAIRRPGMVPLGFADIERLLRGRNAESTLATVETRGENRTRDAIERLKAHPFLQAGLALDDADALLVSIAGGTDLRFDEVEWLHSQCQRLCESAQLVPGTAVDDSLTGRIQVTVVAVRGGAPSGNDAHSDPSLPQNGSKEGAGHTRESGLHFETMLPEGSVKTRGDSGFLAEPPALSDDQKRRLAERQLGTGSKRKKAVQTLFNFDVVALGRFAQTEATLRNGENLDEPTWARRRMSMN
jgi:cell division protein FtsZ